MTTEPKHLRIFLASPGDVADERALALRVLGRLQYDPFLRRSGVRLEARAWDHPGTGVPLQAGIAAQDSVVLSLGKPSECDIVVVILWSRLGTPLLDANYVKPDGSGNFTGTEWEYEEAWQALRKTRDRPRILLYRRTAKPLVEITPVSLDVIRQRCEQMQQVEDFFAACHARDGSVPNVYENPSDFQQNLEQHLKEIIIQLLASSGPALEPVSPLPPPAEPAVWKGSSFPGLRAFTPDDAPIFFGRGRETDGLVSRLANPRLRFLTVVGASGSGKSSLVAAGLIPRLLAGAIAGSQDWTWRRFTPGEVGDNPFMALAVAFKDPLQQCGQPSRELADRLEQHPASLAKWRDLALTDKPDWAELLLFIDQFEELFTLAAPRYVGPFIEWLRQAAQTERLRVVATLRADFYHRCVEWPALAELLRTGSYPLAAPRDRALEETVIRPAERAGLAFENGLAERILDDTGAEPGTLALLAFALAELYDARTADGRLTWAAYERFGGVQGAIAQRAEATVSQLGATQQTLGEVFRELVEIEEGGTVTRRRAPWAQLVQPAAAETLVNAFIDARLLVASRGEDGQPVVEVAHEALFTAWTTLRDWLGAHREQLKASQDLEKAAQEWHAMGERWSGLASGARLRRYCQAIRRSDLGERFLRTSRRRLRVLRWATGFIAVLVLALGIGTTLLYVNGLSVSHGIAMVLDTLGLYPIVEPKMVNIPDGEFCMGSREVDSEASNNEKPRHKVTISKPFAIGQYEVTFDEYDQFAYATGRPPPSDQNWGRGRRPVIGVSWEEAVAYAKWLSQKTGRHYRLPTEAEWEYAARAGSETARFWGDDPRHACQYANGADWRFRQDGYGYKSEIHDCNDHHVHTAKVGSFKPNAFDLYDMLGNVQEWVQDSWHDSYGNAPGNGSAWEEGANELRVVRGGAWYFEPLLLRAAARTHYFPHYRGYHLGFRLVSPLTFPEPERSRMSRAWAAGVHKPVSRTCTDGISK